jgi:hypothetical protein
MINEKTEPLWLNTPFLFLLMINYLHANAPNAVGF